jgi:SAM-dependent methyltransferase
MGNDHGDDGGDLAVYSDLRARAKNYVSERGPFGTVRDLGRRGPFIVRSAIGLALDKRFDHTYGVDTSGEIPSRTLGLTGENAKYAVLYDTPPAATLRAILDSLKGDLSDCTFIDVGSGKGRVLLIASEYGFKKVLGIELSERLHRVAVHNISVWRSSKQRCFALDAVCVDAAEMPIPDGALVLYFFVPFEAPVMRKVVARLEASYRKAPRQMQIVYVTDPETHPFKAEDLGLSGMWRQVEHVKTPFNPAMRYPIEFRRLEFVAARD